VLVDCGGCGEPVLPESARCWRCGYPTVQTLRKPSGGLDPVASAFVIFAVFAVVLFGLVVFVQRDAAIAEHDATVARAQAHASARAEAARREEERQRRIAAQPSPTPVPSDAPGTYRVQRGDSLFSIAARFGVPPNALREWNSNEYPTLATGVAVKPGWVLTITGPIAAEPAPPPPDPVMPPGAEFVVAGGEAVIDADDVVVRTRPWRGPDSQIIGSFDTGARVRVLAGPLPGSGYFWYQVRGGTLEGWVAAGTATDPWIVAAGPAAPPSTGTAAIPDQTATISGAEVRYYEITGRTHWDLIQQTLERGPDSYFEDAVASAQISFGYEPYLAHETTPQGVTSWPACRVTVSFVVTLPRWVGPSPVDPEVARWWQGAFALARDHEARHVQIWQEHLPTLLAETGPAAVDPDCWQARQLVNYWLELTSVLHDQFHVDEIVAGRTWPPPYPAR
jgi:predicted secreted Zn-dependent protease